MYKSFTDIKNKFKDELKAKSSTIESQPLVDEVDGPSDTGDAPADLSEVSDPK